MDLLHQAPAAATVTVTVRSVETGLERVVVTNKDGTYSAPYLPIGKYNVQAVMNIYETFHRADGHTVKLHMDHGEAGVAPVGS